MFTSKDKDRAVSLTGNIIITAVIFIILTKDIFPKMEFSNIFSGDRKKFKAYEL